MTKASLSFNFTNMGASKKVMIKKWAINQVLYQVRAYKPSPYGIMNEEFLGGHIDHKDLETAKKVYEAEKDNHENISLTETPFLVEDVFNEFCQDVGVDKNYEIKYIVTKGVNNKDKKSVYNKQCDKCGKECEENEWFICGDCSQCFCIDCDKALNPHASGKCKVCEDKNKQ
jgi:hypothetical protein